MYIGVFMGPFARGPRDDRAIINYCIDSAVRAAADGFALVTFGEQHFNNYEPYCNPLMMGARLAPLLKDTYFGTSMIPVPYHNPILLAENLNLLDQLLDGRLIVGLSQGRVGFSPDFQNFGLDPADQKAIFAEKFAALQQLWSHQVDDGPLSFSGRWVKGGMHGRLMPMSYRAPRPQLAIGTSTDATCRSAGQDGLLISLGPCLVQDAARKFALYREGLDAGGFDSAAQADRLAKSLVHHQVVVAPTDEEAWQIVERLASMNPLFQRDGETRSFRRIFDDGAAPASLLSEREQRNSQFVRSWFIAGSPDSVVAQFREREAAGIQHILTRFAFGTYNPPVWDASYAMFVREVMPQLEPQRFSAPAHDEVQRPVLMGPLPPGTSPMGYGAQDPTKFREQTRSAS